MSEVKRYGHIGYLVTATEKLCELYSDMTVYVKASDFDSAMADFNTVVRQKIEFAKERDAAESQLAALREELAESGKADHLRARIMFLTNEVHARAEERDDLKQRLADAERRNSESVALLRRSTSAEGQDHKTWWNDRALILQAALNKPEEARS